MESTSREIVPSDAPLKRRKVASIVWVPESGSISTPAITVRTENVSVTASSPSWVQSTRGVAVSVKGGLAHVAQVSGTVRFSNGTENLTFSRIP